MALQLQPRRRRRRDDRCRDCDHLGLPEQSEWIRQSGGAEPASLLVWRRRRVADDDRCGEYISKLSLNISIYRIQFTSLQSVYNSQVYNHAPGPPPRRSSYAKLN